MAPLLSGAVRILIALQVPQASIAGAVRNGETDEAVTGALVALPDLERYVITDSLGRYVLHGVPHGPQHLTVRSIGFAPRTLHALVPATGELRLDLTLRPEPIRLRTLEVRPDVVVRGLDHAPHHAYADRHVSAATLRDHPLLAEPDAFEALRGGEVVLTPETPSGIHIRGGAADHTAYLLDGVPVFSPYHVGGLFSAWNPDALADIHIHATSPSPALPAALSGTVSAQTRAHGTRFRAQGSVSTTQLRVTADGPLGRGGAGYLLSMRSAYPALFAPRDEASFIFGESGDGIAKVGAPLLGGLLQLIGYESENEIDTAAIADADDTTTGAAPARNRFDWRSRSLGAGWTRSRARSTLHLQTWSATAAAGAHWAAGTADANSLGSHRHDVGGVAFVARQHDAGVTTTGIRLEQSRTSYRVLSDSAQAIVQHDVHTPVMTAFIEHDGTWRALRIDAALSIAAAAGRLHFGPRTTVRWSPTERLAVSGSYARLHQFAQSLRNSESIAGSIFPADLYVGAGSAAVPIARADQWVIAAEHRPAANLRVAAQLHQRNLTGVLLVPVRETGVFSSGDVATGSGTARGLSVDMSASGTRFGAVASYGWQQVRMQHADSAYVPSYAAQHVADAGIIVYPAATFSLRAGVAAALGRRASDVSGELEWEACNLLDRGCEFGGTPRTTPPGASPLPHYVRIDIGARKHWHVHAAGRDAVIELFGTVTNVLAHRNVLTYTRDPGTGARGSVEMRPLAPLVVGLDWRF